MEAQSAEDFLAEVEEYYIGSSVPHIPQEMLERLFRMARIPYEPEPAVPADSIRRIIDGIEYGDWEFKLTTYASHGELQLCWHMPDSRTGEERICKSRKWRLSYHMTESEIVFTCLLAVKIAEEHEIHERFKYRGRQVVNPHVDVTSLLQANDAEDRRHSVETEMEDAGA